MTARQGSQVRLDVRVTGIPTPVVKFYRDGVEIQSSPDFQILQEGDLYSLIIAEAYPEDSGTYSVNATNNMGRATSTAELLIQGNEAEITKYKNKSICCYNGTIIMHHYIKVNLKLLSQELLISYKKAFSGEICQRLLSENLKGPFIQHRSSLI